LPILGQQDQSACVSSNPHICAVHQAILPLFMYMF